MVKIDAWRQPVGKCVILFCIFAFDFALQPVGKCVILLCIFAFDLANPLEGLLVFTLHLLF